MSVNKIVYLSSVEAKTKGYNLSGNVSVEPTGCWHWCESSLIEEKQAWWLERNCLGSFRRNVVSHIFYRRHCNCVVKHIVGRYWFSKAYGTIVGPEAMYQSEQIALRVAIEEMEKEKQKVENYIEQLRSRLIIK